MHVPPSRVIRPQSPSQTTWIASAELPTKNGPLQMHVFRAEAPRLASAAGEGDGARGSVEHVALVAGDIQGLHDVPVRVHSECITSEVFGSLKCDCRDQLDWAQAEIVRRGAGAVLYLRQEGRGIGLGNKIRAYELQAKGLDTVDANRGLGLPDDARSYDAARDMLDYLRVESVQLMTNNPDKIEKLRALGVDVRGRIPTIVPSNPFSAGYLEAKRVRMAHDLPARPHGHVPGIVAAAGAPPDSRRFANGHGR
jgi:GTP cyclohydrolase II